MVKDESLEGFGGEESCIRGNCDPRKFVDIEMEDENELKNSKFLHSR